MIQRLEPTVTGDVPSDDVNVDTRCDWLFDFAVSRLRVDFQTSLFSLVTLKAEPHHHISLFNGTHNYRMSPRTRDESPSSELSSRQPDVYVLNNGQMPIVLTAPDYPVLFAAGCFHLSGNFDPRQIRNTTAEMLGLTQIGIGQKQGQKCVVVRAFRDLANQPDSYDEFWVNVERNAAIVFWEAARYVVSNSHKLKSRMKSAQIQTGGLAIGNVRSLFTMKRQLQTGLAD